MEQQPGSFDTGEDLNQMLREFERDNAHFFTPPIETPPMPHYDTDFPIGDFLQPMEPFGVPISGSGSAPPAPPPSLANPSPLATAKVNGIAQVPCAPFLVIYEQPIDRCRFRYKAEQGPHGALRGVSGKRQKSSPKVKVENIRGRGYVVASLWTNEEIPRPHVNELWGSECDNGLCKLALDANMTASFSNLGIMRQKEKEVGDILYEKYLKEYAANGWTVTDDVKESLREKAQKEMATMKDCLHCVRVGFQAFVTDASDRDHMTPIVLSSPIYNSQNPGFSELRIAELDKSCGTCLGGDTIWMRCAAKIRRDQIKIKFHEAATGWEVEASFSPNEVYEQILVIFKTPPYRDTCISDRVHVSIHLFRTTDGEYSTPVDFVYLPVDDGPKIKRPRRAVPAFGPDGFGYANFQFEGQSMSSQQTSTNSDNRTISNMSSQWSAYSACLSNSGNVHPFRKRHLPRDATRSKQVPSLDSGIEADPRSSTQPETSMSAVNEEPLNTRIEQLTLMEVGRLDDTPKVQAYLSSLWHMHVKALWDFGSEGDPEPFVAACKHLIGLPDENGNNALHITVRSKQAFALKTMLKVLDQTPNKPEVINMQNNRNQTPLHLAVRYGDADCVHYLMKSGADRRVVDSDGMNPVHYLAETFNEAIYRDILFPPHETPAGSIPVDIDALNNEGVNVLHLAIKRKKLALLETLLEAQAKLDIQERNTGKYPLHMAAEGGDCDVVEFLLQHQADLECQTFDGNTALQLAVKCKNEQVIARLVAAGADIEAKTCRKAEECTEQVDEEIMAGEGQTMLLSALDLAGDDADIVALLRGKPYAVPDEPGTSNDDMNQQPGPSTGARPKTIHVSKSLPAAVAVVKSSSTDSMPDSVPVSLRDDLSSLDFVARLRLSKLLDVDRRWEKLATALNCQHMVELIAVCTEADRSSPTILLLDQYEQLAHPTVSRLLDALQDIGLQEGVDLIVERQNQQQQTMERLIPRDREDVNME